MPNQPKTPVRAVRVDDELWAAAKRKAEEEGESVSDVVRRALRKYAGLALVALVLSACTAAHADEAAAPAVKVAPAAAARTFTVADAVRYASEPVGTPLARAWTWPCDQPMRISIAASPGWTGEQVYDDLQYAVAYLQALGYDVSVVAPSTYRANLTQADAPTSRGDITVAVAPYRADQPALDGGVGITYADASSALMILDASRGGLLPDVILHEFGHVLGLDHREVGSVMSEGWANSGHFDADETATVTCH